ncbi:MAG: HEPN domain-containing protein [Candidatus Moranbacteria bacterium]|nr:HEPN domain-containing protein [Candidatus Moranbacteria bacterium]
MKKTGYKKLVEYWQKTAEYDYDTMKSLLRSRRYASSLFFGHIVLEKILKALVVANTKDYASRTHDLVRLYKLTGLKMDTETRNFLDEVNKFNLKARYPEYKMNFYKKCTKEYCGKYINEIDSLYKKLCQKLKPKK